MPVMPDYDTFVDWDARLSREAPFFRELFERAGVSRVIDVGAGSARHAILFATWGLQVVAVDPSDEMLERARANAELFAGVIAAGGGSLEIVQGGFGELGKLGLGPADAITCTGNALPHVAGRDGLTEALADFAAVLTPGGMLVLHLLNHERLLAKRPRTIPAVVRETPAGKLVFLRVLDYSESGEFIGIDFLSMLKDPDDEWTFDHNHTEHTVITAETLRTELSCAGFSSVEMFGGHDRHSLTAEDESVLVTASRW